ncbi:MAG: hypothetical protein JO083_02390 [Candidatus Eremiobacteraeota bacterium]|nr:hypothetical protein [Candidatus Eremiobacteraeota bacterium]
MQHTTGVAALATQPSRTDRRALSQAWYSALHLAEPAPRARATRSRTNGERPDAPPASRSARTPSPARAGDELARRTCKPPRAAAQRRAPSAPASERRAPVGALGRRIAHAPPRSVPRGIPSAFAVRAANGSVHLLVREDGARTRVVAACAPRLRERVERALAHARVALAQRGIAAEAA